MPDGCEALQALVNTLDALSKNPTPLITKLKQRKAIKQFLSTVRGRNLGDTFGVDDLKQFVDSAAQENIVEANKLRNIPAFKTGNLEYLTTILRNNGAGTF
jgi:hypothetical protein